MRNFKKFISVLLTVAMTVTLCAVNPSETQAAVRILTGSKMTLTVGETDYIVSSPKGVSYKSSNKKIVTVTKKGSTGKLKAKKAGIAKITVKTSKGSKKVTVTVKPKKVTIKSADLTSVNSAKVTWKKLSGVTGYYVYYAKNGGKYKKVTVKGASKTTTTIKNLELGRTYSFKVKAYVKSGKKYITSNSYSKVKSVKTWKQVWSDEFNYTDKAQILKNWSYEEGHGVNGGWGNNELQHYTNTGNNVLLTGNTLVIQPKFEYIESEGREEYTSARLVSRGKKQFKYGKIEFRAKVPSAQGTWAATWMLGQKNNWPYSGEIDIMETLSNPKTGLFSLDRIPQTIHNKRFNGMPSSSGPKNATTIVNGSTTGYHTYGIIWTSKTITFTIDGKKTWTYDPGAYVLDGDGTDDSTIWPYNDYFYLLMNVAVGGTLGGKVDKDEIISEKGRMYIDWVRVYQ